MAQTLRARKDRKKISQRAWCAAHPKERAAYQSRWEKEHPVERKSARLRARHGIIGAEFQCMHDEQNHRCKLCRVQFTAFRVNRTTAPNIDHSHECPNKPHHKSKTETGGCAECIRGLICHTCNIVVVRFLELYPSRQTDEERAYMADRPILRYRTRADFRT